MARGRPPAKRRAAATLISYLTPPIARADLYRDLNDLMIVPPNDLDALAEEMLTLHPKKRAIRLKTEGAFHTYYMVEAARRFRTELDQVHFAQPRLQVLSNYTGGFHESDAESIKSRLFFQLFHPVNWVGCLQTALDQGINLWLEFGGGIGSGEGPAEKRPNLEGIIKKFTRRAKPKPAYLPAINLASIRTAAATET